MAVKNMRAAMFNKRAEKNADKIAATLDIKAGDVIADLGSGGGFFTFMFAGITGPSGKVYAVDTDTGLLAYIEKNRKEHKNIETVSADEDDPNLPAASCDFVFLRNVFHHIPEPTAYFQRLKKSLKPNGRIAIVEWNPDASPHRHGLTGEQIQGIMLKAGYRVVKSPDFLEKQSFNIFQAAE